MKVNYLKNCGVYLDIDGVTILVDGLNKGYRGYSFIDDREFVKLFAKEDAKYSNLDYLAFTHYHTDHYCKTQVEDYTALYPQCEVVGPKTKGNYKYQDEFLAKKEIELIGIEFPHSGNELADILHHMILIKSPKGNVLLGGDANFQSKGLADKVKEVGEVDEIKMAFFNPLFVADRRGRETIEALNAEHTYIYHMPEGDHDPMKVKAFAMATFHKTFGDVDNVTLLEESMQKLR